MITAPYLVSLGMNRKVFWIPFRYQARQQKSSTSVTERKSSKLFKVNYFPAQEEYYITTATTIVE